MKLVFSTAAEADLEAIGDYIALENPLRAVSYIREIRGKCMELREMPEAFPPVPHHEATGIRRRVHGNYLIFYRIHEQAVEIIRVLHGSMDYRHLIVSDEE